MKKWLEWKHQIVKKAAQCPNFGAKTKRMNFFKKIVYAFIALIILSIFICQCGSDSPPASPSTPKAKEATQTSELTPEKQAEEQKRKEQEEAARQEQEALALGLRWQYDEFPDKMGRGIVKTAIVRSLNEVNFDFPYIGPQRATLHLRIHPRYGKDVIITIERGQFLCDIYNSQVAVRFDNGKAQNFKAVEPADNSTTALFIRGYDKFLSGARKAKKVYIEAQFFQQGTRVFEFDISGLKW